MTSIELNAKTTIYANTGSTKTVPARRYRTFGSLVTCIKERTISLLPYSRLNRALFGENKQEFSNPVADNKAIHLSTVSEIDQRVKIHLACPHVWFQFLAESLQLQKNSGVDQNEVVWTPESSLDWQSQKKCWSLHDENTNVFGRFAHSWFSAYQQLVGKPVFVLLLWQCKLFVDWWRICADTANGPH